MSGIPRLALTGPEGPFPRTPLTDPLERRWLHYAFFSRDGQRSMIANIAWLGADSDGPGLSTAVLLTHDHEYGFRSSEWNAFATEEPWSAFRAPRVQDGEPFRRGEF